MLYHNERINMLVNILILDNESKDFSNLRFNYVIDNIFKGYEIEEILFSEFYSNFKKNVTLNDIQELSFYYGFINTYLIRKYNYELCHFDYKWNDELIKMHFGFHENNKIKD